MRVKVTKEYQIVTYHAEMTEYERDAIHSALYKRHVDIQSLRETNPRPSKEVEEVYVEEQDMLRGLMAALQEADSE